MMKRLHGYHSIISYIVKVHLPIIIQNRSKTEFTPNSKSRSRMIAISVYQV
ncbi:hypothetical protein EX192_04870 [Staphylococcus epidermidis]|nr:hypothetical protein [Staphylococcus epidermidis]